MSYHVDPGGHGLSSMIYKLPPDTSLPPNTALLLFWGRSVQRFSSESIEQCRSLNKPWINWIPPTHVAEQLGRSFDLSSAVAWSHVDQGLCINSKGVLMPEAEHATAAMLAKEDNQVRRSISQHECGGFPVDLFQI